MPLLLSSELRVGDELCGQLSRITPWGTGEGKHSPFPQDPHRLVGEADVGLDGDHLCDDPRWKGTQPMGGIRENFGGEASEE